MFFGCGCCTSATNEQEASFRGPMMPEDGETLGDIESPKVQRYEPGATKQVSVPELSPEPTVEEGAAFSPSKQATTVTFAGESVQEVSLPLAGRKTDLKSRKATGALRPQDIPSDEDDDEDENPEDAPRRLSRKGTAYVKAR
eukprot:CAMPEP_0181434094 /NCGR_PEP_ID=MMETSP1110-20121109/19642_1 /TAXON_ID=174948 /ORGANISM="Symbiodinium sp., Strain CCMP421" /LENGTH=141 /DNA_ID=CAMNT_0023557591 /DNA_START=77 /DNA_END=502 /DNA_ORIENTATION=-